MSTCTIDQYDDFLISRRYFLKVSGLFESDTTDNLDALVDFCESAFAFWILPKNIIILEKPKSLSIQYGQVVELGW